MSASPQIWPVRGHEVGLSRAGAPLPAEPPQRQDEKLPSLPALTRSDEARRVQDAAARLTALLSGGSLLHARPPSLAEQAGRHAEAAAHFEAGLLRWPRHAWGWLHLLIKASLHTAEWLTESFPRAVVAFAVWTAVHLWLWPPLPWF